jgi:hypothetical protein
VAKISECRAFPLAKMTISEPIFSFTVGFETIRFGAIFAPRYSGGIVSRPTCRVEFTLISYHFDGGCMYEIEATVTETGPTELRLTANWPVDWLRGCGIRTVEIQRQLFHGELLEPPSVPTERAEIDGNRANWPKLLVGNRVLVRCFFPGERTEH